METARDERCTLILTVGGHGPSAVDRLIGGAHHAIALDTIEKCVGADWCDRIIVSTDSTELAERLRAYPVIVELDASGVATAHAGAGQPRVDQASGSGPTFHFGRNLRHLIHRHGVRRVFYVGGGSAALLPAQGFAEFAEAVIRTDNAFAANNYFSTDFIAFSPAEAIDRIDLPENDNGLALAFARQAGLTNLSLNRTVGSQFDVDTPTDLLILSAHPRAGPHTRAYLAAPPSGSPPLDNRRVLEVGRLFTRPTATVTLAGRVATWALALLQREVACKTRIFAEERGMRAEGREGSGKVRTLTGYYLEAVGPDRFFATLAELGDAALLDTRPLFAHLRLDLSSHDRFHSDLMQPEAIQNPVARAITEAARRAPIPVVLGGHSVVSGGMWALIETAWLEHDELVGRADPPTPPPGAAER